MKQVIKYFFLLSLLSMSVQSFGQRVLYLVPSLNQTRPIDLRLTSTQTLYSNIHSGLQLRYFSKELGFGNLTGSVDLGFTINKYEYATLLHKWDHGLEGVQINPSIQRIQFKQKTFSAAYGLSQHYKNFLRLEFGTGFSYTMHRGLDAVQTSLSLSWDPAYSQPELNSSYTTTSEDHINFFLRFSAIASPGNRTGVGLSVTYNMIPEKLSSGEFTLSNNTGSSYLKSTFSPRLLTINFGLYINLYRTKE